MRKFFKSTIPPISISKHQTNIIKGIGMLMILFHNYFHWVDPNPGENEFDFYRQRIFDFYHLLGDSPYDFINLIFSYFGHFGVQLFIFISGYGLAKSFFNKRKTWAAFVKERIMKIYPTFLIGIFVLLIYYIITKDTLPNLKWWEQISYKLLMIHTLLPGEGLSINGPWWFYGLIFQLYLLFPFLFKIIERWKFKGFVVLSFLSYLLIFSLFHSLQKIHIPIMENFIGHIPEFVLGIYMALNSDKKINKIWIWLAAGTFVLGNLFFEIYPFTFLAITLLLLVCVIYVTNKFQSDHKRYSFISFYGKLSMYVFAIHGFFRPPFVKIANEINNPVVAILLGALFFITITGISFASQRFHNEIQKTLQAIKERFNTSLTIKRLIDFRQYRGIDKTTNQLMSSFIILTIVLVFIRLLMMIWLKTEFSAVKGDFSYLYYGMYRDIVFGGSILGFVSIPIVFIGIGYEKLVKPILVIILIIFSTFTSGLSYYFLSTQIPLDNVVLVYSLKELFDIISSSGGFNSWSIIFCIIPLLVILSYILSKKHKNNNLGAWFFILVLLIPLSLSRWMNPSELKFPSDQQYYKAINYVNYLIRSLQNKDDVEFLLEDIDYGEMAVINQKMSPSLNYFNESYPFFHNTNYKDDLSKYFNSFNEEKPNFVFIIFESLGSSYSGAHAKGFSVTPFVDSLSSNSLYWPNCLSTAERTFGALPGIFSSFLSFTDARNSMPLHNSLLQVFDTLGYNVSFFYGGDANFNGMEQYIKINKGKLPLKNTDITLDVKSENLKNNWGWDDITLFNNRISNIPIASDTAFVDIYLTLSSHRPFLYKNKLKWEQQFKEFINTKDLNAVEEEKILTHTESYASLFYADNALRNLFNFYKNSDTYDNTIFIITGDHAIGTLPSRNSIDRFNVPLIIHSPKIKNPEVFNSVVSHFDIAPSTISFIDSQLGVNVSKYNHWMGYGLSYNNHFECNKRYAFVRNNRNIEDLIFDSIFLSKNQLYRIEDGLELVVEKDTLIKKEMMMYLDNIKKLKHIVFQQNCIIPKKFQTERNDVTLFKKIKANFEDDISIHGFNQKLVTEKNTIDGKRSVLLTPDILYGTIAPHFVFDENFRKIEIDLRFDYKFLTNETQHYPSVIFQIENGGKSYWYKPHSLKPDNFTQRKDSIYHFSVNEILRPEIPLKWQKLKVYLFNPSKNIMMYDNIEYQIIGNPNRN